MKCNYVSISRAIRRQEPKISSTTAITTIVIGGLVGILYESSKVLSFVSTLTTDD